MVRHSVCYYVLYIEGIAYDLHIPSCHFSNHKPTLMQYDLGACETNGNRTDH